MGVKEKKRRTGIILPLGITAAMIFMGGDFIPLSLRPLDYLDMPYPHILRYTHVIVPLLALGLWLVCKRSNVMAIVVFLTASWAVTGVAQWAEQQPVKIHVTRMIDSYEWEAWQKQLGFKVWETGNQSGTEMWVDRTPGRAEKVTQEVKRMSIWRP